jgi:hypothetical protein
LKYKCIIERIKIYSFFGFKILLLGWCLVGAWLVLGWCLVGAWPEPKKNYYQEKLYQKFIHRL